MNEEKLFWVAILLGCGLALLAGLWVFAAIVRFVFWVFHTHTVCHVSAPTLTEDGFVSVTRTCDCGQSDRIETHPRTGESRKVTGQERGGEGNRGIGRGEEP